VYEFLRNGVFDARNFYATTAPQLQRNQFGGSLGGPIRKNKTFFFADYAALILNQGVPHHSPTLSPLARTGVLCVAAGSTPCASTKQFAIDSKIVPYLGFFPVSNGAIINDEAFYDFTGKRIGREHYGMGKLDHNFSDRTSLAGSYQIDGTTESQPDPY